MSASMFRIASRVAAAIAAFAAVAGAASPPGPLPPTGMVALAQSDQRLFVMLRIGAGEILPMIFDTGSDGHSIDRLAVRHNRLRTIGATIEHDGTTGRRRALHTVAITDASLGGLSVGTIEAAALDYDRDDAMGIVSPQLFAGRLVRLDLARNRAAIVEKTAATIPPTPASPYLGGLPATDLVLPDGKTIRANLDTGYNGELSLPLAMMTTLPLIAPATVVGRFRSIDASGEVFGGQIRGTVRIGPLTLESPHVTFLGNVANVGLPLIRRTTLLLDPADQRSWLLPLGPR